MTATYCASCKAPHEEGLSPDGSCVACGGKLTEQRVTCAGCGAEFEEGALAADTRLCYTCDQRPDEAEGNACMAPVTSKQCQEVFDNVSRKMSESGPLTAASVWMRLRDAAAANKKDPQS